MMQERYDGVNGIIDYFIEGVLYRTTIASFIKKIVCKFCLLFSQRITDFHRNAAIIEFVIIFTVVYMYICIAGARLIWGQGIKIE